MAVMGLEGLILPWPLVCVCVCCDEQLSTALYRLVCRVTAGVGLVHEAGRAQHHDDLLRVVGLRVGGLPCR